MIEDPLVFIKPKPKSSIRTKNRVRENGPIFSLLEQRQDKEVFVKSEKTEWAGWLPLEEINIEEM